MNIKSSRGTAAQIVALLGSTPSLLLVVSASLLSPARAQQDMDEPDVQAPDKNNRVVPGNQSAPLPAADRKLLLPLSVLDQHDSLLLREILLSHGIEVDLSDPVTGDETLHELIDRLRQGDVLNRTIDYELLLDEKPAESIPRVTDSRLVALSNPYNNAEFASGVSREWKVIWLGAPEQQTPAAAYSADEDPAGFKHGVSLAWTSKVIESRPAIDAEILLLPQRQDITVPDVGVAAVIPDINVGLDTRAETDIASSAERTAELPEQPTPDITSAEKSSGSVSGGLIISDEAPPGFESLSGPQTSFVDLFFNGRKVGSISITTIDDELLIDEPSSVIALLKDIRTPAALEQLLAQPLPTNADRICYREDDPPGCGQIDPDPVAAIYDQDNLRLDLFIASDFQSVQSSQSTRYLPVPVQDNTSILSLYAVASDLEGQESALDLSGRALVGYGKGNILAEADYNTRTSRQRLREFKLTHYLRDHELVAGTYSFQPGAALSDISLLGVSFATSLKTRVDLEYAFSTELVVYLNRRSVVQIAVNDRVYTAASYAAGNQALDTQLLPDGTYEVEIRILDALSGSRVERRLFTKSALIPPRGETIFNVTAGVPLIFNDNHILPDTTNTTVAGFSFSKRLNDQSAYRLGLLQFGANSLLQSEYIYLGSQTSLQLAASAGERNTLATAVRAAYYRGRLSFTLSGDLLTSAIDTTGDQVLARLFPTDFRQVGLSIRKSFQSSSVGLRVNYREEVDDNSRNSINQYSLNYRRPLSSRRTLRGFVDIGYQQDDVDQRVTLQVRLFTNHGRWNTSVGGDISRNDHAANSYRMGVESDWQSATGDSHDWGAGVYTSTGDAGDELGARLFLDHPWFAAGATTGWNQLNGADTQRSSIATLSAHLGVDRKGAAIGGADFAQAGVIVAVKGAPAGARFDILVNGIKSSSGKIGTTQFIGLQPFEVHTIKLIPQTVLSNGLGEEIYEFSLYPGTVQRIDIQARRQVLLIATLVNKYGELIENAVVESGGNKLLLEAGGFLQAEVSPGDQLKLKQLNGDVCEFTVPDPGDEEVLVIDKPILCREIATQ